MLEKIHEYFDEKYEAATDVRQKTDVEKTRGMVVGYALHYQNDGYKTVAIEQPFELPICDPISGESIPGATYNGIIDWVVEKDGKLGISDHKTASRVDQSYWLGLRGDQQITHYELAARQMELGLDFFLWDVILKPTIKPVKLTKKVLKELEEFGTYLGIRYEGRDWQSSEKETPKMYGSRVLREYTSNPEKYFIRREVHRGFDDVIDYLGDLNVVDSAMNRTNTEGRAIRNRSYCKSFGSLCEFHNLCFGDRTGFEEKPKREGGPGFSANSRSTSSVALYMDCRRKWYYSKVMKLQRQDKEYQEALEIGTMFHEGLEVFLRSKPSDMTIEFTGNLLKERTADENTSNETNT